MSKSICKHRTVWCAKIVSKWNVWDGTEWQNDDSINDKMHIKAQKILAHTGCCCCWCKSDAKLWLQEVLCGWKFCVTVNLLRKLPLHLSFPSCSLALMPERLKSQPRDCTIWLSCAIMHTYICIYDREASERELRGRVPH